MLKELHAVTCKYGKVQDMTNFKTMRKMNVISISKKRKRCGSIAQKSGHEALPVQNEEAEQQEGSVSACLLYETCVYSINAIDTVCVCVCVCLCVRDRER